MRWVTNLLLTVIATLGVLWWADSNKEVEFYKELGTAAVVTLYDFGTVEQLDAQMATLKQITTDEVFQQLTIDNEERTLNTYLKFKGEACTVIILESTENYIIYSLQTPYVESNRKFIFRFTVNGQHKIDWVRESELIDFMSYD